MKLEIIRNGVRIRIAEHESAQPQDRFWHHDHVYLLMARANGGACLVREGHFRDSLQRAGLMVPCRRGILGGWDGQSEHAMALTKAGFRRADAIFAAQRDRPGQHNFRKHLRRTFNLVVKAKTRASRYANGTWIR